MNLPPKAIAALVDIKAELLSKPEPETVIITPVSAKKERRPYTRMRHAKPPNAYQRWRQRGDCW